MVLRLLRSTTALVHVGKCPTLAVFAQSLLSFKVVGPSPEQKHPDALTLAIVTTSSAL